MKLIKRYEFEEQVVSMYQEGTKYKVKSGVKVFTFNNFNDATEIFDAIVKGN